MLKVPSSAGWTLYRRDLPPLRIKAPDELPMIRDPKLFCAAVVMLVPGLVMLALWIAYLVRMW